MALTRSLSDRVIKGIFFLSAFFSIIITFAVIFSIALQAFEFFSHVALLDFLFGTHWNPHGATPDELKTHFGSIPLFTGTFLITFIALGTSLPLGLIAALYLVFYASPKSKTILKPALEILAGIPSVVYGFFALIIISPLIQQLGYFFHVPVASENALSVGLVMGLMIMPAVTSLSEDLIAGLPQSLTEGSLALGATPSEGICKVVVPAAFPGLMAVGILALSRAIGETMIVVMAAGFSAHLTANPLDAVTTVTVQIVNLLTGDQEFNSPTTLSAFGLGLTLFLITLFLNSISLRIVRHYRLKYE